MKLVFTGADKCGGIQARKHLSLGGFPSSNVVPNNVLNGVFDRVSLLAEERLSRETICLAIFNDGDPVVDLSIWIGGSDNINQAKFKIGVQAVLPTQDGFYFEKIDNTKASPYNVEFHETDVDNKIVIDGFTLDSGKYLAMWIQREIVPYESYESSEESISLNVDWVSV